MTFKSEKVKIIGHFQEKKKEKVGANQKSRKSRAHLKACKHTLGQVIDYKHTLSQPFQTSVSSFEIRSQLIRKIMHCFFIT